MATRTRSGTARQSSTNTLVDKEHIPQQPTGPLQCLPTKQKATHATGAKVGKTKPFTADPPTPPAAANNSVNVKKEDSQVTPARTSKKRKHATVIKSEGDPDELPHNLGTTQKPKISGSEKKEPMEDKPARKQGDSKDKPSIKKEGVDSTTEPSKAEDQELSPSKKPRKTKANSYGLTPGISPFPDWPHPTPEECQQVNDLLSSLHGAVKAPETIPAPSLTSAGCGEVPCVLDALIRTYLSAATSGTNSSRAFQSLISEYGRQKTGIGKGSVNWDAVRHSPVSRIFDTIRSGGLADVKSRNIKKILNMVYEENQTRRNDIITASDESDPSKAPKGAENASKEAKDMEVKLAEEDVLSLDFLHSMSPSDSFNHLLHYPGIGVKTASCVSLFCLRRPSFAVDTHVFRLCQWLGWVPPKGNVNRNTTFMHCEVRIPDELKYSLHHLMVTHGKRCGRCRAITGEGSQGWEKGCVIDHLVQRTGVRKGGAGVVGKARPSNGKAKKVKDVDESSDDDSESDMDVMGNDESDFEPEPKSAIEKETPQKLSIRNQKSNSKKTDPATDTKSSPATNKRKRRSTAAK
ncbi:MAG: hypothetical protein Q9220_007070 [cf. Caloplaca sp. 1 TL-2023]